MGGLRIRFGAQAPTPVSIAIARAQFALAGRSIGLSLTADTGLAFLLANNAANSDIGLNWTGANLLDRTTHTALWKIKYIQQSGYYAVCWHCHNDGTFHGFSDYGTHPYPCDNTVDANGAALVGTGAAGTAHSHEIALSARDFLCTAGGPSGTVVTTGIEYWQARTCELISGGTIARHIFYPDVQNNPSISILQDYAVSEINNDTTPVNLFRFGTSPWTATAGANSECPSCTYLRFLKLYNAAKTLAQIQAKFTDNNDETSDSSRWYSCINPTPTDITDKSGQGHTPVWATANRPTAWP